MIDPQETLLRVVQDRDRVVRNISLLIEAAQIFDVPIVATTQYREKLGTYPREIIERLKDLPLLDKMEFSALRNPQIRRAVSEKGRSSLIICGVETHICVYQTALSALEEGYRPVVVIDATSSRNRENFYWGASRLRDLGIAVVSTEMLVYEWLERAGTSEFRALLPSLKDSS
ncbi:isochorismatase family protein [Thermosulfurimonas sp. F29]|uniref:isochorismatase family protein n=1 Tax=Thermosulfurimonas sp. F29 TaxID=2867247 RepID=UPI001C8296CB|nr:isochorismatase family protein [Thermosulfurimonas sp. F29]MBX6422342.1 isochorismatase family protein [Thermosulfurimonas sp. F29]